MRREREEANTCYLSVANIHWPPPLPPSVAATTSFRHFSSGPSADAPLDKQTAKQHTNKQATKKEKKQQQQQQQQQQQHRTYERTYVRIYYTPLFFFFIYRNRDRPGVAAATAAAQRKSKQAKHITHTKKKKQLRPPAFFSSVCLSVCLFGCFFSFPIGRASFPPSLLWPAFRSFKSISQIEKKAIHT